MYLYIIIFIPYYILYITRAKKCICGMREGEVLGFLFYILSKLLIIHSLQLSPNLLSHVVLTPLNFLGVLNFVTGWMLVPVHAASYTNQYFVYINCKSRRTAVSVSRRHYNIASNNSVQTCWCRQ